MRDDQPSPLDDQAVGMPDANPGVLLTLEEARVLGSLIEKEATTPEYYPLTFKALQAACNQTSNRDPIMALALELVEEAAESLRFKRLAVLVHQAGSRVAKCRHTVDHVFPTLTEGQRSILGVLLLRGAQSAAELRQRTERMHSFADADEVEADLEAMAALGPSGLVRVIPSGAGRRVATYEHTLCGEAVREMVSAAPSAAPMEQPVAGWRVAMEGEMAGLREEIELLRGEIRALKSALGVEE